MVFRTWLKTTFLTLLVGGLCLSCATHPTVSDFDQIKNSMEKADVIEVLGPPHTSQRRRGVDVWTYRFWREGQAERREIHFVEGAVIYAGPPRAPQVPEASETKVEAPALDDKDSEKSTSAGEPVPDDFGKAYDGYIREVEEQRKKSGENFEDLP